MPISSELLSKAAKVYEAAEAVEDMKPKEVYESHKKCAPGEFNMHKEGGFMQSLKTLAEKQAGPVSEYLSGFNPLNWYGGSLAGGGIALATPTRSLKEQAEFDANDSALRALTNVLVPGVGAYRGFKRIGAAIRSPEMKDIKMRRTRDKAKRDLDALDAARGKEAGWKTEMLGSMLNPLNLVAGNYLGAGAAGLTRTRTLNEQSAADDSTWSNLFIPGQAQYNWWKRIGAATRSPEMKAMRNKVKLDRLRQQAGEPEKAPAQEQEEEETSAPAQKAAAQSKEAFLPPGAFMPPDLIHRIQDTMAKRNLPLVAGQIGGDIGGLAGLVGGGIYGAYAPGSYSGLDEKGNPVLQRRSRLMGALRGAAGYGLGGALTGAALGNLGGRAYVNATQKNSAAQTFGVKLAKLMAQ